MRRFIVLLCLLLTAPAAGAEEARPLQERTAINQLGAQLLAARLRHNGMDNAMVSSPSLFTALSVLALGADGASRDLLRARLLSSRAGSATAVADTAGPLLRHLHTPAPPSGASGSVFSLSQGLWSTDGDGGAPFPLRPTFVEAARSHYGAGHRVIPFRATGASQGINRWAEEQTRGLIDSIINDATLAKLDWLILTTALFEGGWGTAMRSVPPGGAYRFESLDGDSQAAASIRTLTYTGPVVDMARDGSVAFALPFAGGRHAFIVHLPAAEQGQIGRWILDTAIPELPGTIQQVLGGKARRQPLMVQLPSFRFSDAVTLGAASPIAADLGLSPLFDRRANLAGLSERASQLGLLQQHSRIELNEHGVRAAAATLIGGIAATSFRPAVPARRIVVNRPFVFAIVERTSQTLLFNGVLVAVPPEAAGL